jgi:Mrp family chromosome partitioning ATPase/capsular polysaccharide biosynthesis protein
VTPESRRRSGSIENREHAGAIEVFAGVAKAIRRRALLVILVPLIAAGAVYWVTANEPDQYKATASMLMRDRQLAELVSGYTPPYQDPTREAQTNLSILSSNAIADRVAQKLPVLADDVHGGVSVTQGGGSDLVYITASTQSPETAAVIANTWAREYIAFRKDSDRAQIEDAIGIVDRRLGQLSPEQVAGDEGARLRDQRNKLEVVASLQTGNAELVQPAVAPSSPYAPEPVRKAVLAGIAGLVVAILGALLLQRFDRRIGEAEDMEVILQARILGDIPDSRRLRWRAGSAGGDDLGPREREAFRVLRANVTYYSAEQRVDSILVTSATSGEGKSTVAIHLARAFADVGVRTLLLEGDWRRSTLAARLKLGAPPGLAGLLSGEAGLDHAGVRLPLSLDATNGHGDFARTARNSARVLDVLPAGALPDNSADVLDSSAFKHTFERLKESYDMIIVDGPPVLGLSDTITLSRLVSGVLVVARLGVATTTKQRALERQLDLIAAPVIGLVLNGTSGSSAEDGYYVGRSPATVRE